MAAKKKATTLPANREKSNPPAKIVWATMTEPEDISAEQMPEGFEGYEVEQIGGLCPMATFEKIGDMILGHYQGSKELNLDGRKQQIYYFTCAKEMGPLDYRFGVWGSTVIDDRMFQMSPQLRDRILIRFVGETESKKGNPAKVFQVARLHEKRR